VKTLLLDVAGIFAVSVLVVMTTCQIYQYHQRSSLNGRILNGTCSTYINSANHCEVKCVAGSIAICTTTPNLHCYCKKGS
jgi:hypothetical protein